MRKKIEAVIFDMDGLMFDTERIAFKAWRIACANWGYEFTESLCTKLIGITSAEGNKIILAHFGEQFPLERISSERRKIMQEMIDKNGVPVKEGLFELLDFLKAAHIKTAVATSTGRDYAVPLLEKAGVARCFNAVVCGDDISRSKPDPQIFLTAAAKTESIPERCIVLEDSAPGILAARRAYMLPVLIPDMKHPEPEYEKLAFRKLSSLKEVRALIEEL